MTHSAVHIAPEAPSDLAEIGQLHGAAFGPGRFARTAFRIREDAPLVPDLSFTLRRNGVLIGSIRFSHVRVGALANALWLGPLAISPDATNQGHGLVLMRQGLQAAGDRYAAALLVGDLPYYARAGFERVPSGRISLPGPVDPLRLLACELKPGTLETLTGPVLPGAAAPHIDASC